MQSHLSGHHEFGPHERERVALLRLFSAHPHCFGAVAGVERRSAGVSVGPAAYESIDDVGYDAPRDMLAATVRLARPLPGLGDPCERDALEYVRFFVEQGRGWENAGLAVFDPLELLATATPESRAGLTLRHQVTLGFLPRLGRIGTARLAVRAIIAWGVRPPADAHEWRPRWGDVREREIALHPSRSRQAGPRHAGAPRETTRERSGIERRADAPDTSRQRTASASVRAARTEPTMIRIVAP